MPAWGIRTALVALRTFMGEEGTAGQVGGMEASKDVRERMAKSSKQWRCDACGGNTNEEIMREWWEICREKGIDVEEEAGLEELPEGLKMDFKDQIGKGETKSAAEETTSSENAGEGKSARDRVLAVGSNVAIESMSSETEPDQTGTRPGRSSEKSDEMRGEALSPSASPSSRDQEQSPTESAKSPSLEARSIAAQSMRAITAAQLPPAATPILDKAISGLVLALLFMVLKKVLYNPNVIAYDY